MIAVVLAPKLAGAEEARPRAQVGAGADVTIPAGFGGYVQAFYRPIEPLSLGGWVSFLFRPSGGAGCSDAGPPGAGHAATALAMLRVHGGGRVVEVWGGAGGGVLFTDWAACGMVDLEPVGSLAAALGLTIWVGRRASVDIMARMFGPLSHPSDLSLNTLWFGFSAGASFYQ
jgi:hypothetical protein